MIHKSVLLNEALNILHVSSDGVYIDATVGGGGHAEAIAERLTTGFVIGLDCDASAIERAKSRLASFGDRVKLFHANFQHIDNVLDNLCIRSIHGALFDLGVSSFHLDASDRGFSFRFDALLDMRMDQRLQMTAADAVNTLSYIELTRILFDYGEERYAKRIAQAIVGARSNCRLQTTLQLADVIENALPMAYAAQSKIHPATRTFQALRVYVNDELATLKRGLALAWNYLEIGGSLVAISFHSLEDRIVKEFFREKAARCVCPPQLPICVCNKISEAKVRPMITPAESEIRSNSRSRSAKLRAATKLDKRQEKA